MSYSLADPVPATVPRGNVFESVQASGGRAMWVNPADGHTHLFAAFGGFTSVPWYAFEIDMVSGAQSGFLTGATGDAARHAYCPIANKHYIGGNYHGSFVEYDATTQEITVIGEAPNGISAMTISNDEKVYFSAPTGSPSHTCIYSYTPGDSDSWTEYGVISFSDGSTSLNIGADATHIYVSVKNTSDQNELFICPVGSPNSWSAWTVADHGTDAYIEVKRNAASPYNWYVHRGKADNSVEYYWLSGGGWTLIPTGPFPSEASDVNGPSHCFAAGTDGEWEFGSRMGYDIDTSYFFPVKTAQETSTIGYKLVAASDFTYKQVDFTGDFVYVSVKCLVPATGSTFFSLGYDYTGSANIDYTQAYPTCTSYLGVEGLSPYVVKKHPTSGEIYYGGYSNKVMRYNPGQSWLINTNPYNIVDADLGLYHYRHKIDFDYNGLVWIGGNTTRTSPALYGNVMWYNPATEEQDYIFTTWQANGVQCRDICSCLSKTRILVSNENDEIYKINVDTKAVIGSPINPAGTPSQSYMIEVSNDRVMVINRTDAGAYTIGILQPSDMTWNIPLQSFGVSFSGEIFGFSNSESARILWKLELGPDNYVWMFLGNELYRINQGDCSFSLIRDFGYYGAIKFAPNNLDLAIYYVNGNGGDTNLYYVPGILTYNGYSKGAYFSLPADDTDLSEIYTSGQREDVALDDEIRVGESGTGYILHEFKDVAGPYDTKVDLHCNLQAPLAPADYPVYLQCYDRVTIGGMWVTVVTNNAAAANTDFDMDFQLNSGTTPTFANCKDESGVISSRVYQTNVPLS